MRSQYSTRRRRGAIIPLVAICLVVLMGMVALAIDIGMVAVAKCQAQNAADTAAMAAVRTFNGQAGYNLTNAPFNAVTAATQNKIFNSYVPGDPNMIANPSPDVYTSGAVKVECGGYYYVYNDANPAAEAFQIVIPGKLATEPYTGVRATITTTSPIFFGAVWGASPFNVIAHSIAAHRPRDVVIIMDLSGSMRFQSCPGAYSSGGYMYPHWGPRTVSLNPDSDVLAFGHYSATNTAKLQGTTAGTTGSEFIDPSNYVANWAVSGPPCAADIMTSGSTPAFSAKPSSQATTPGGDDYLKTAGVYVKTVTDVVGTTPTPTTMLNFCRNGYTQYNGGNAFNGYTEGSNYWGKTFFIWPPDPRGSDLDATVAANHADNGAKDWRQRFFFKKNTSTNTLYWLDHNNILFNPAGAPCTSDSSGVTPILKTPQTTTAVTENGVSVNYRLCINYAAVFQWLRNQSPTHFPASMTSGRINFYSSIPDPTGDSNFNTRFWTQSPMTSLSERFWKDYVDFMLGYAESGANSYGNTDGSNPYTAYVGGGDMFAWGTVQVTQKQDCNYTATASGNYNAGSTGPVSLNNVKNLAGTTVKLPGPTAITNVQALSPAKITSAGHGLITNDYVTISDVGGGVGSTVNSNGLNPRWKVTVIDANTYTLTGSVGNGAYGANTGVGIPAITAVSNTSPIVITTGAAHSLTTGMTVKVSGVLGNTAANGKWTITVVDSRNFKLDNTTGNGAFTAGLVTDPAPWWEPVFYLRFGYGSTFYEMDLSTTASGTLTASPDIGLKVAANDASAVKIFTQVPKYMDYVDNPYRPRHQYWFGPQTWLDWLGNYSIYQYPNGTYTLRWPGNVHEAQAWSCKVGISSSIDDIRTNHPNDYVGLTFFSSPSYSTSGGGQHNMAVIPLGRNYQGLKDSLWFPPSTVSGGVATITPYDNDFQNVPRAKGGTCPGMGFMISYNLLSSSTTNLRSYATPTATYKGYAGGLGRKGASRLVIFETDGAPNTRAVASLAGSGANSYYPIRIKDPTSISNGSNEFPTGGSYAGSEVYDIVKQIVALDTAASPGYSTSRKPAQIYCIGYGSMFDPVNSGSSGQGSALDFLQSVQYYGNVNTAGGTSGANFPDWQRVYGDNNSRKTRMQTAFTKIMQSGVQVSLIE